MRGVRSRATFEARRADLGSRASAPDRRPRAHLGRKLVLSALLVSLLGLPAVPARSKTLPEFERQLLVGRASPVGNEGGPPPRLTQDPELQRQLRHLLARARPERGAALLVDVESGRILAMDEIGAPDPTLETGSLLFDALSPAASLMKLVTTAALYESSDVTPALRVCTRGALRLIQDEHLTPPRGPGVHCAPFGQALAVSKNAAYAQLAHRKLTVETLLGTAESLGWNRRLLLETRGTLGSLRVPREPLAFARTAAGFGDSSLSVVGAAQLALTVASGGRLRALHGTLPDDDAPGTLPEYEPRVLSSTTVRRITRSMEMTVEFGTAAETFRDERGEPYLPNIPVAGKTGTLKPEKSGPTTSWFVGFAPSNRPKVVVAVVLWNSDRWHQKGNMVGRDLLRTYFHARGAPGVTTPLPPRTPSVSPASREPLAKSPSPSGTPG